MTTYLCAKAHGKRFTAIPVFPMRAFHHGAIVYNTNAGIRSPKDLEGRRVGVNRGYTVTTGLWARSVLQHEYGVDLEQRHVGAVGRRARRRVSAAGERGRRSNRARRWRTCWSRARSPPPSASRWTRPDVQPLSPTPAKPASRRCARAAIYPINHTVVVKNDLLDVAPGSRAGPLRRVRRGQADLRRAAEGRIGGSTGRQDLQAGDGDHRRPASLRHRAQPEGARGRSSGTASSRASSRQPFTIEELFPENTR